MELARYLDTTWDEKVTHCRTNSPPHEDARESNRNRGCSRLPRDIVIFDPATIADHATFDQPRQSRRVYVTFSVNGVQGYGRVHTGAKPGQFVMAGWTAGESTVRTTAGSTPTGLRVGFHANPVMTECVIGSGVYAAHAFCLRRVRGDRHPSRGRQESYGSARSS